MGAYFRPHVSYCSTTVQCLCSFETEAFSFLLMVAGLQTRMSSFIIPVQTLLQWSGDKSFKWFWLYNKEILNYSTKSPPLSKNQLFSCNTFFWDVMQHFFDVMQYILVMCGICGHKAWSFIKTKGLQFHNMCTSQQIEIVHFAWEFQIFKNFFTIIWYNVG
jgi:hypothetical protein